MMERLEELIEKELQRNNIKYFISPIFEYISYSTHIFINIKHKTFMKYCKDFSSSEKMLYGPVLHKKNYTVLLFSKLFSITNIVDTKEYRKLEEKHKMMEKFLLRNPDLLNLIKSLDELVGDLDEHSFMKYIEEAYEKENKLWQMKK